MEEAERREKNSLRQLTAVPPKSNGARLLCTRTAIGYRRKIFAKVLCA